MIGHASGNRRSGYRKPNWPYCRNDGSMQAQGLISWWTGYPRGCAITTVGGAKPGACFDLSPRRNNAQVNWTVTHGYNFSLARDGAFGCGMYFNGTATYIGTFDNSYAPTSFSIVAWAAYMGTGSALPASNCRTIYCGNVSNGLGLWPQATGRMAVVADGALRSATTTNWATFKFHHLACTSDGTTWSWYLNGVPDGTYTMTTPVAFPAAANAGIGGIPGVGRYAQLRIADLRAYDYCLGHGQIRAMYEPRTRWELYYQPRRKVWFTSAAAPPAPTNQGATLTMMGV